MRGDSLGMRSLPNDWERQKKSEVVIRGLSGGDGSGAGRLGSSREGEGA